MLSIAGATLIQILAVYLVSQVLWGISKRFFIKPPLDALSGPPSSSFLSGNLGALLDPIKGWSYHRQLLDQYGQAMRINGFLGERILFVFDPKALHRILVKDMDVYEPIEFVRRSEVFLGQGLVAALGEKHRKQRKLMNPIFSINHIRDLIPIFHKITERVTLRDKVKDGDQEIDILHWMSRTALELIGQSGLGYSFDTLTDDEVLHSYPQSMKKLVPLMSGIFGILAVQYIFPLASRFDYPRVKRFIVEHIPWARVQELKDLVDTLYGTSLEIINAKKDAYSSSDPAVANEMMTKKDIISVLMRANLEADEADRMSDVEVYGQVATFVASSMDTTSSALTRVLHLLSTHKGAQERLREEIREAQANGQLTYDQLISLPYLDAVFRETLRLYPPLNFAALRTARNDGILPLSKPVVGSDGRSVSQIVVPKGTNILISILGANTNPELWGADAYEWKPERWLSPLPRKVGEANIPGVYSHLMTFLGGGRACIGFKFSELEMKTVLAVLLSTFKFEPSRKHEITWKMNIIASPYVDSLDPAKPQMPIVMSLID